MPGAEVQWCSVSDMVVIWIQSGILLKQTNKKYIYSSQHEDKDIMELENSM